MFQPRAQLGDGENSLMLHIVGGKGQGRSQIILGQFWIGFEQISKRAAGAEACARSIPLMRVPLMRHVVPISFNRTA